MRVHVRIDRARGTTGSIPAATMTYRFDGFALNPATRELRRGGEPVALPARAFDCLAYLIERRERAVGRDELIAAVWGRVEISDALLGHTIVKIRRSLGDTGNEQRTIRTVPRFGYRWAMPVEVVVDIEPAVVESPPPEPALPAVPASDPPGSRRVVAPARWPRSRRIALAGSVVVALAGAVVAFTRMRDAELAPVPSPEHASVVVPAEEATATAAMVLPAEVDAPEDSQWLRLGVMDLVANRLRAAALPAMPSESVVSLLRQRKPVAGDDLLHDPSLADAAALRVLPRVVLAGKRWQVRLDAFGAQRALGVEAQDDDAIVAARKAADELLRRFGRTPAAIAARPAELDDLLQRSGAAMLADQLAQARDLVAAAPPALQQQPALEHRMAQIELRSGDYDAAEVRMHALLDRREPALDDALRARALLTLAAAQVRSGRAALAGDLYDEAIALGAKLADHEVLGVARLGRGAVFAQEGRYDEATGMLSRARTELAAVGDGLGIASVDVNLGEFLLMQHRPAEAASLIERAVRQFERLGAREGRAYALAVQVAAQLELLDSDGALATSERVLPFEQQTNNQRMRWTLARARADALVGAGRAVDAAAVLTRIEAESDPKRDAVVRAQAALASARVARGRDDPATALEAVTGALVPALRDADPTSWTRALVLRAELERGRSDAAAVTTASLRTWAADAHDDWRTMQATAAEAAQAAFEGRREPALELYAKAMRAAERSNVPADLVAIGAPYLDLLVDASQLDAAQAVSGRIAAWAGHDPRVVAAQARMFRALGQDDAARGVEEAASHRNLAAGKGRAPTP